MVKASELRFRSLFENATLGLYRTTPGGQVDVANPALVTMLGYESFAALAGRNLQESDTASSHARSAVHQALDREGVIRGMESAWTRRDGSALFVRESALAIKDENGVVRSYEGIVEDVTERRRAEDALRESEQRLNSIYNTVSDIIFHLAVEPGELFRFLSVNAAFLKVTGLSPEAVVGKTVNEVIPEPSRTMVLEMYRKAVRENTVVRWEETSHYPTGRLTGAVSVAPVLDSEGRCTRLVGSVHDITESKRVEEQLRESEECLKTAERLTHVGYWRWEIDADRITCSEEVFRLFGRPHDYVPTYGEFLHALVPQDRETMERAVQDCFARKKGASIEFQIVRPNGELRTVTSIFELILDNDGVPVCVVGGFQDVTDFKREQEKSFEREKLESVGTLANGIAHDFNNLMGAILSQAELAQVDIAAGMYPEDQLKGIKEVAIRGSEIVRELMLYAGRESDLVELVDVSRLMEEMLGLLRVSVSKHARLEPDLCRDLPPVRANAAQLRRIVMNLVTNASEAIGDRDGVIRVTTKLVPVVRGLSGLPSESLADGDYLQLEVSDTGVGMSPETQARIFDPFFTTKPLGHGLGMAVVQGIVRRLGGFIYLTSEPNKGTTFRVLLSCAATPASEIRTSIPLPAEPPRPSRGATILVVEDEDSLRLPVSKLLRKAGFSVVEAGDGTAALQTIRQYPGPIDFLLLDVTLPGASSLEVLEEAIRLRPDVKVIVTSAYSADAAAELLNGKVEHFLRKPYRIGDLVDLVRRTLW